MNFIVVLSALMAVTTASDVLVHQPQQTFFHNIDGPGVKGMEQLAYNKDTLAYAQSLRSKNLLKRVAYRAYRPNKVQEELRNILSVVNPGLADKVRRADPGFKSLSNQQVTNGQKGLIANGKKAIPPSRIGNGQTVLEKKSLTPALKSGPIVELPQTDSSDSGSESS